MVKKVITKRDITDKDMVMLRLSRLLLEFSKRGVIVLDVENNANHSEAGDFLVRELAKYIPKCHIPETRYNLQQSLRYIALNAIVPENGVQARSYKAKGIKYSSYCVNEINKSICIFTALCKLGAVKLDMFCVEHRDLIQLLKDEILLYKQVFPWEDVFTASVRIMDMAAAIGYLQRAATGRSEFLEAVGSLY